MRIAFCSQTRKTLIARLADVYASHTTRLIRRLHALLALGESKSVAEVAEELSVGEQTVRDWLHHFIAFGVDGLIDRSRPGRPAKLTKKQSDHLKELILTGPDLSEALSACWTARRIADLIERTFGVSYAPRYVCHLLDRLGLSYQKARFTSDHLNPDAQLIWLEETWPAIVRQAKEKEAVILFGDEASFAQWGSLGYTWALKGVQPTVKTSGIRKAYRVFGLLDCFGGKVYHRGLEGKFNSETYQDFLAWALTQIPGQIILIQDNVSYHVSAQLTAFYTEHADRLTVHQLPAYSPELNPIEGFWNTVKEYASHLRWFPHFTDLVTKVTETLERLAETPQELTALMGEYKDLPHP